MLDEPDQHSLKLGGQRFFAPSEAKSSDPANRQPGPGGHPAGQQPPPADRRTRCHWALTTIAAACESGSAMASTGTLRACVSAGVSAGNRT